MWCSSGSRDREISHNPSLIIPLCSVMLYDWRSSLRIHHGKDTENTTRIIDYLIMWIRNMKTKVCEFWNQTELSLNPRFTTYYFQELASYVTSLHLRFLVCIKEEIVPTFQSCEDQWDGVHKAPTQHSAWHIVFTH